MYLGVEMQEYLVEKLNVSRTMLAGMLQVSTQRWYSWRSQTIQELAADEYGKRLIALYDWIERSGPGILLNSLYDDIDPNDEGSPTHLHQIVHGDVK